MMLARICILLTYFAIGHAISCNCSTDLKTSGHYTQLDSATTIAFKDGFTSITARTMSLVDSLCTGQGSSTCSISGLDKLNRVASCLLISAFASTTTGDFVEISGCAWVARGIAGNTERIYGATLTNQDKKTFTVHVEMDSDAYYNNSSSSIVSSYLCIVVLLFGAKIFL